MIYGFFLVFRPSIKLHQPILGTFLFFMRLPSRHPCTPMLPHFINFVIPCATMFGKPNSADSENNLDYIVCNFLQQISQLEKAFNNFLFSRVPIPFFRNCRTLAEHYRGKIISVFNMFWLMYLINLGLAKGSLSLYSDRTNIFSLYFFDVV
jgi:hypothetical protein